MFAAGYGQDLPESGNNATNPTNSFGRARRSENVRHGGDVRRSMN